MTDTNTVADLHSRIAEADQGVGIPLDVAYERWKANARAREEGRSDAIAEIATPVVNLPKMLLAASVALGVAMVVRHALAAADTAEDPEHYSVDPAEEPSANAERPTSAHSSAPMSHAR